MLGRLKALLEIIPRDADDEISCLSFIGEDESQRMINSFNEKIELQ
jgi:hypothetical protein